MKTALLPVVFFPAARAQTRQPCESAPEIEREMRNPALTDLQIAFEGRWAAFHDLLRKYPEDVSVHRRYQGWLSGNWPSIW
jgi:hypothetical protein